MEGNEKTRPPDIFATYSKRTGIPWIRKYIEVSFVEEGKTFLTSSPFKVCRFFKSFAPNTNVKILRNGKVLLDVNNEKDFLNLRNINQYENSIVNFTLHPFLNYTKGVIFCPELNCCSEAELQEELRQEGVVQVRRIYRRTGDTKIPTSLLIITFEKPELPGLNERWFLNVQHRRLFIISIAVFFAFTLLYLFLALHRNSNLCRKRQNFCNCNLIVPDIIHFYRSEKEVFNISKSEGLCIKAAGRFHDNVWIHTTDIKSLSHQLEKLGLTSPTFKILPAPYGPGPVHINILRKYGGIFLKNDVYLINRLDQMRGHDWSSAGEDDIVAGTKDGVANGIQQKLKEILFDKSYGALFIKDLVQNCTYSAVRLGLR